MSTPTRFSSMPYTGPAPTNRKPYVPKGLDAIETRRDTIQAKIAAPYVSAVPGQDLPTFVVEREKIVDVLRKLKEDTELRFELPVDLLRRAVFAGSWYPARASECEADIQGFIEKSRESSPRNRNPVGGIVPHAGWFFSGRIACHVIHGLKKAELPAPDVVMVFGMHLHSSSPNIMMPKGAWETPFGDLPVAEDLAAEMAKRFPFRLETPEHLTQDNTIELQLPFIKYFFPEARILAMGVPPTGASLQIGRAVVETARGLGLTLKVIGSTDLTHYGTSYGFSGHGTGPSAVAWVRQENDRRVIALKGSIVLRTIGSSEILTATEDKTARAPASPWHPASGGR